MLEPTVALTRARKMCVIFCPLDMKGLIGPATVMGSLMYGAGHCWHGTVNMHSRGSLLEDCPGDDQFLSLLDLTDVLRKGITKFAAYIWSLLICGDPGKSIKPRYVPLLVH